MYATQMHGRVPFLIHIRSSVERNSALSPAAWKDSYYSESEVLWILPGCPTKCRYVDPSQSLNFLSTLAREDSSGSGSTPIDSTNSFCRLHLNNFGRCLPSCMRRITVLRLHDHRANFPSLNSPHLNRFPI